MTTPTYIIPTDVRVDEPMGARHTLPGVPADRVAEVVRRYAERGYLIDRDRTTEGRVVLVLADGPCEMGCAPGCWEEGRDDCPLDDARRYSQGQIAMRQYRQAYPGR